MEPVSSDCCRCCWSRWSALCMHELFKEKDIIKANTHTQSRIHPPPPHTHTRSTRVCIYEHIFFMCISLDFVVVRMETRLSNWKFLLPPRLLQFLAIPLQFPLLLYSLLFLSSSHSPSPSPSPSCCCCCSR